MLVHFRSCLCVRMAVGCLLWAALGGAAANKAPADDSTAPGRLSLSTRRIIAFKDGYCLIVKDAEGSTDERGEVYTTEVPDAAVLGSFWATSAEGRLTAMVAGWETRTREESRQDTCTQVIEILLANQGAEATIEMHDKTRYSGHIVSVLAQPTSTPLSPPLAEAWRLASWLSASATASAASHRQVAKEPSVSGASGEFFVLRNETGDMLLPVGQVRSVTIPSMKTTLTRTITLQERTKQLTFRFADPAQRRKLSLMYFRPGVRWIPTYRIDLAQGNAKKTATITLQAEVLNEAEDFGDAALDIIVGVPNFRFRNLPSPLALEQTLRNTLAQAEPVLMGQMRTDFSNALFVQRSGEMHRATSQAAAEVAEVPVQLPQELVAQGTQDMFVYHLPPLHLKRGERATAPIFTAEVPYRDIYTWDLRLQRQVNDQAPSGAGVNSPLALAKNEVWHQVVLTNKTDQPWTTGAAMLLEDGVPLGQELLTYTSRGAETRVPITVAVDVRGNYSEEETGREQDALTWGRNRYTRVTKQATLELHNHKTTAIEAEITFRFGGKTVEASEKGTITLDSFNASDWTDHHGDQSVNNSSTVRWTVKLEPRRTFRPSVTYHYYVRQY